MESQGSRHLHSCNLSERPANSQTTFWSPGRLLGMGQSSTNLPGTSMGAEPAHGGCKRGRSRCEGQGSILGRGSAFLSSRAAPNACCRVCKAAGGGGTQPLPRWAPGLHFPSTRLRGAHVPAAGACPASPRCSGGSEPHVCRCPTQLPIPTVPCNHGNCTCERQSEDLG